MPERIYGLRYERRVRRFESCRALQNCVTVRHAVRTGIDIMLRTFKHDICRMTGKRVIWGVVS